MTDVMIGYRRPSIPVPSRTALVRDDLRHLATIQRILQLLNDPAASASALAPLVESVPVLGARLRARFGANAIDRSTATDLAFLGNREFETVLFSLLEELTELRADAEGIPAHGSMYPPLRSVRPPPRPNG